MVDQSETARDDGDDAGDDEDMLHEGREVFELCVDREAMFRPDALDDIKFARLEEQWPADVRAQRESEGRPCLTINRLPVIIRQVVNDQRLNRPSIKTHPVDSQADPQTAEILNGLIRNIEVSSNADVAYDTAFEGAVGNGFGYFRINTAYAFDDTFEQDLVIEAIPNPFSVYGDPYSTSADSADWNDAFITELVPKSLFERKYKGAKKVDWKSGDYGTLKSPWIDGDQILVAEWWHREEVAKKIFALSDGSIIEETEYEERADEFLAAGIEIVGEPREVRSHKVTQRIMSGAEVLETNDWAGRYIPIVPVFGETVNVEGKRYLRSLIRGAKDAQRMLNYHRSTTTELIALAPKTPFIGPKGAFQTDAQKWETANTQSWSYIEYDGNIPPQRQPYASVPSGSMQEALNASDDLKSITGIYDASLGARSNETSGRAIMARQREGDVSTFHFIDNLSRSIRHAGRILIDLIPKVYSTARMIRILGEDGTPKQAQIAPGAGNGQEVDPQPQGQNPNAARVYDLTVGKYDLTVTAGPSFTSKREEAATQMTEFIRSFPAAAPVIGDLLAKNLDWPGADEIAKRLKGMVPPQAVSDGAEDPRVAQLGQQIQQLQAQLQQAQGEQQQAQAKLAMDARKIDIDAKKADIDGYKAETERLSTVAPQMGPEAVQALVLQTLRQVLSSPDVLSGAPPQPAPGPMVQQPQATQGF